MNNYNTSKGLNISKRQTVTAHFQKHTVFYISCGLFILSLALRVTFYMLSDRISRDSYTYIKFAELLYQNDWDWNVVYVKELNVNFPPLLIMVMAFGAELGIDIKLAGDLFVLIMGSLIPIGIFLCSDHIFKKRIYACFAAMLIAVHPYSIELSANILRDAPYHCFFVFALLAAIHAINSQRLLHWVLFAIIAGLAALSRREGIELILIFLVWNVVWLIKNKDQFKQNFILSCKQCGVVFLCFLMTAFPLWLYITLNSDPVWELLPFFNRVWIYFL